MISIKYTALISLRKKFYDLKEMLPRTERDRYIRGISQEVHRKLVTLHDASKGIYEWSHSEPVAVTLDEVTVSRIEEVYDWMKEK